MLVELQTEQVSARLVKSPEELDDFLTTLEQMAALRAVLVQSSAFKPASDVNILQTWEALTRSTCRSIIRLCVCYQVSFGAFTSTQLNHFALKGKLYRAAIKAAFGQLSQLCPQAAITS